MKRKRCVICGKGRYLKTVPLKHGELTFCNSCREELTSKINGDDHPVVWIGLEDYTSHFDGEPANQTLIKELWPKEGKYLAQCVSTFLWEGCDFGDTFHNALQDSFEGLKKDIEKEKIEKADPKELPLMVGNIEFKENEEVLEKKLKEG